MNIFFQKKRKRLELLNKNRNNKNSSKAKVHVCPKCGIEIDKEEISLNNYVCPKCNYYYPLSAKRRLALVFDENNYKELNKNIGTVNVLEFPEYDEKIKELQKKTGLKEAVVSGVGKVGGTKSVVAVMDSRFLMGSMGVAVGEKITKATEYAMRKKLPLIIFCASGGARMQEGIFSLMQMAKTSAAIGKFREKGGLFISYLTHPTTGGVTASFASLGDIIIAEPDALIGFAGPRVIEKTIGEKLPKGFQRSEYLVEHGFVDKVVDRKSMKSTLVTLLELHKI